MKLDRNGEVHAMGSVVFVKRCVCVCVCLCFVHMLSAYYEQQSSGLFGFFEPFGKTLSHQGVLHVNPKSLM